MKLGLLATLVVALATGDAEAYPGTSCTHTSQCSSGEVCVADDYNATHGHCVRIRVLP